MAHIPPRLPRLIFRLGHLVKRHYVLFIALGVAVVLVWAGWSWLLRVPGLVGQTVSNLTVSIEQGRPDSARNYALAIGALLTGFSLFLGIPFQVIRMWINERQTNTIEQGHVTDRLTKAIEQLGAEKTVKLKLKDTEGKEVLKDGIPVVIETSEPNLEVRLGAIYALERIAQDSERDHIPVIHTLCAYVRQNSKTTRRAAGTERVVKNLTLEAFVHGFDREKKRLPEDIDSSLNVVRSLAENRKFSHVPLSQQPELNFSEANLTHANLIDAPLRGAIFWRSDLTGAVFYRADLEGADLRDANVLNWHINAASLRHALLFMPFNLNPATLEEAFGVKCGIGKTLLPEGVKPPEHWHKAEEAEHDTPQAKSAYEAEYRKWLKTLDKNANP